MYYFGIKSREVKLYIYGMNEARLVSLVQTSQLQGTLISSLQKFLSGPQLSAGTTRRAKILDHGNLVM